MEITADVADLQCDTLWAYREPLVFLAGFGHREKDYILLFPRGGVMK